MRDRQLQGKPIQLPELNDGKETRTQSQLKVLIQRMICPEAKDRIESNQVCEGIKVIEGNKKSSLKKRLNSKLSISSIWWG